ncbi:MAG: 5-methyltetrahydropteroyltriglutamate--homocysteine S-methyltransferase [Verrucomicrobiales bacterium]|nr:5-methyltetrahydropteroyltriglutamate--homocysteine S-methyltransferase [Verrucomicrobiales bacterium]
MKIGHSRAAVTRYNSPTPPTLSVRKRKANRSPGEGRGEGETKVSQARSPNTRPQSQQTARSLECELKMKNEIRTHNLGFPRIGTKRELKRALESYWSKVITEDQLLETAKEIRAQNWKKQKAAGIDLIPSNDFSLYDQMLDMSVLVGAIPERFPHHGGMVNLATYFGMARGTGKEKSGCESCSSPATAMEMTKWFDTNYHYLVPEFHEEQKFHISSTKPFAEFQEALRLGIQTMPVLIGPITFLLLGKNRAKSGTSHNPLTLLDELLPVYTNILTKLQELGAEWIQMDEPALCLDLTNEQRKAFSTAYGKIGTTSPGLKIMLTTYFGDLRNNLETACALPVAGIHWDAVRGGQELDLLLTKLPEEMLLSIGVVDGRNIWTNDFKSSLDQLEIASERIGLQRVIVSPSCSLLHSPLTLNEERKLDGEIKSWLAFGEEKLVEVTTLSKILHKIGDQEQLAENTKVNVWRKASPRIHNSKVKNEVANISEKVWERKSLFERRKKKQQARLQLPLFPTTTIGSFPQTVEIRSARARYKKGELSPAEYDRFLAEKTSECVRWQSEIGLDVLVHGEFERNDMVEYFGEQLAGFAFTENGWVQSYGSRCVKPPIIFGDVHRPEAMTVRWTKFAQSLTDKPMKGMLTGPITILQWSFVRDDQPRELTARQIALALRKEVLDLESAGIAIIQIDEPALREGLPLRHADWDHYLKWAVDAFRLTASGVRDDTQIHTHMCYCEFDDILESIAALDADVISIETSRSNMELIGAFANFHYPNDIGPGVWDIHSPRIPSIEEILSLIKAAANVIPREKLWINPDCGLKTRHWSEVKETLTSLVAAARHARELI